MGLLKEKDIDRKYVLTQLRTVLQCAQGIKLSISDSGARAISNAEDDSRQSLADSFLSSIWNQMQSGANAAASLAEEALVNWLMTAEQKQELAEYREVFHNVAQDLREYRHRLRPFTNGTASEFSEILQAFAEFANDVIVEGKRSNAGIKIAGSKLVVYDAALTSSIELLVSGLEKISRLAAKHGAADALYGRVLVQKAIPIKLNNQRLVKDIDVMTHGKKKSSKASSGGVGAYYRPSSDIIVVQLRGDDITSMDMDYRFLRLFVHELGHRVEHKFGGHLSLEHMRKLYAAGVKEIGGRKGTVRQDEIEQRELGQFATPYATSDAGEMFAEAFAALILPQATQKIGVSEKHIERVHETLLTYYRKGK